MRIKKAITFLVFFSFLVILIAVLSPQFYAKTLGDEQLRSSFVEKENMDLFEEANIALNQDPERAAPPPVTDELELLAAWGGPIGGIALRDNLAYISTGQRFVVLDVTDTENPIEVGMLHFGEPIKDIILRGNYAYVISKSPIGNQFSVIDISNSEKPEIVWNSQHVTLPTLCSTNSNVWPEEIALYGDLAYIMVGPELFVFDISDPKSVQFMNRVPNRVSGHCDFMEEITIKDDLMYIIGSGFDPNKQESAHFFWIYDLSKDPQNPGLMGEIAYHDIVRDFDRIEVAENYAYITGERNAVQDINQLFAIDISDPALPRTRSVTNISQRVYGLASSDSGNYLYFTTLEDYLIPRLEVYNVSDPSNPTFVSEYGHQRGGRMRDITSFGSQLYIVDDVEGMFILNVADPADPMIVGKYYSPPDLGTIVKQGKLAYVLDRWNGFVVLDLGNRRETPTVVGRYQTSNVSPLNFGHSAGGYRGIVLKNERAYLAADEAGIEIVDISDPENPVLEQTITGLDCFTPSAESVALAEVNGRDILSVGCGYGDFITFDVTNPSNVQMLAQITAFFRSVDKMEIHKDGERTLVFIVADVRFTGSPLIIVDISNPTEPEVIYTGPLSGGIAILDISIKDDLLYFPGTEDWRGPWDVFIQNISNPVEPVTLSRFRATTANNVAFYPVESAGDHLFGDRLYGTGSHYFPPTPNFPNGLYIMALTVYNVTDPTQPQELDALQISREHDVGDHADLVVDGSFLYFTQYESERDRDSSPGQATGLTIYRR